MDPTETDRILERMVWAFTMRRPDTELRGEWVKALAGIPYDAADSEITAMIEQGSSAPSLPAFMGRLRSRVSRPVAHSGPLHPEWQGPTDRGRALAATARANLRASTPYPTRWADRWAE